MSGTVHFALGVAAAVSLGGAVWCAIPSKNAKYWDGFRNCGCTVLLAALAIFATAAGAGQ